MVTIVFWDVKTLQMTQTTVTCVQRPVPRDVSQVVYWNVKETVQLVAMAIYVTRHVLEDVTRHVINTQDCVMAVFLVNMGKNAVKTAQKTVR